jgi:putative membrane protein insertion efficiency factor
MSKLFILLIRLYQIALGPFTSGSCRYFPSCSDYAIKAFKRHGSLKGSLLTLWRLLRCGPWCKGGFDFVPKGRKK